MNLSESQNPYAYHYYEQSNKENTKKLEEDNKKTLGDKSDE